ncbi:MAG: tRNA (N(6)-L-threonylcarbamoyladenosine(37)-C(2))-methylthiotransferase MtaB [Candidatus Omnitrophota bacterium]
MKSFKIKTLGCKVNQYESQLMREGLFRSGYEEQDNGEPVDICIINTCTVTKKADDESRWLIRNMQKSHPKAKIFVTGCYAQDNGDELAKLPGVSIVKNSHKNRIAQFLTPESDAISGISAFAGRTRAYIKIEDGCDNRCSFCKVWQVRGRARSRPSGEIIEETKALLERGYKELVLIGVCLGAYGKDNGTSVSDLIADIQALKGDFRIRLSSIEVTDITKSLEHLLSVSKKLCPHLHIPLQSGDDEILKAMNRNYTSAYYVDAVDRFKSSINNFCVTTDVIIGFPGETRKQFENTINVIDKIKPLKTHIFPFSPRPGTRAADLSGQLTREEMQRRMLAIREAANAASYKCRLQYTAKALRVLAEHKRDKTKGLLQGCADNYIKVNFKGPDELMNKFVQIKINGIKENCAEAELWT